MDIDRSKKKVLSVFSLVMINVIAVDSLRSLPINAQYGFSIVFFLCLAALVFFIPIALVAAELATGWPMLGGMYIWVREAFGKRWGLLAIWLQWIYNVIWYPTILAFIAATLAYLINPNLADNKHYMITVVLIAFWLATLVNCFGMKVSSLVSTLGAIFGTLLPMAFIIILGLFWLLSGHPSHIEFTKEAFFPHITSLDSLAFMVAVLFGLIGMEMSAIHAEDVKNPKRDYPKALAYSTLIIFSSLLLSSLAIAVVVPHDQISLVSGLIEAFSIFFNQFHMRWMGPVIVVLIAFGAISSVSAWVIGPTRGLMVAIKDESLPPFLGYTNKYDAPVVLLISQAVIFTFLCCAFLIMPTVNSSYWILSALTAQLALIVYLFMFAAVIKLKYKYPSVERVFKVPGGKVGLWCVAGIGFLTCLGAIFVGFFPPPGIEYGTLLGYETKLIGGMIIFSLLPMFLYRPKRFPLAEKETV